ncbi:MAG: FAD-dependent oxidoreductase [Ignavibacteriales bacterium]|nr:FAD-dependent oxidoreductase [Ignavibacteriales bacterium]
MHQIKQQRSNIAVIGGGVVGLTTAFILSKEYNVTVVAEHIGTATDSIKASAIWHVYLVPETDEVLSWAQITLEKLYDLETNEPSAGVEVVPGVELFRKSGPIPHVPSWSHIPKRFKIFTEKEVAMYNKYIASELTEIELQLLRENPVTWGYYIDAPAADMQKYLSWLEKSVINQGVKVRKVKLSSFDDISNDYEIIINCSGLGARELTKDRNFIPYKGQYFVLKASTTSPKDYVGDDYHPNGITYVIPRLGEVLVGGWAEKGCEDLELTLKFTDAIRKAGLYTPWLQSCSESDQARSPVVGIRPARVNGVRLETDTLSAKIPIVHNYGHGGSGFSLSWGCAEAVKVLVLKL